MSVADLQQQFADETKNPHEESPIRFRGNGRGCRSVRPAASGNDVSEAISD